MHRTTIALVLLACTFTAHATEPQPKRVTQGYAGACQSPDAARITQDGLSGLATAPARVLCSPGIDTSQNGTTALGLTLTNTRTDRALALSCTAKISTAKPGPQVLVPRTVMVSPRTHGALAWASKDVGEGKTFRGGQIGITCTLPAGVALSNVWTQSVAN